MRPTKPDKGWAWVVLVAAFLEHCVCGFCMYAVGLFHISILEKFHESVTKTSWISSIFLCLLSLSGPLASVLINRWDCRFTMILGSILLTGGLVVTAFADNIYEVFIFFGVLSGIGIGLLFNAGYIVLAFNFEKKRNIATGFAVSGCGVGPFILSPIYQMIHQEYGYTGFFLFVAALALQACVFGAVLRPSKLETSLKIARKNRKNEENTCFSCDLTVYKSIPILCVCLAGLFFNIGIFLIYLHFPKYAMENGSDEPDVAMYLSVAGLCSCFSRVLLGMASNSDHVSENILFFGSYTLLGITTLLLPLYISSHSARTIYSVILGLYQGTCYVVMNTIVLKLTGPDHVAKGTGYVMAYIGAGTLIGPPLGGFLADNGGSYDTSFKVAGVSLVFGGILELCNVIFKAERFEKPKAESFEVEVHNKEKIVIERCENETFIEHTNDTTKDEKEKIVINRMSNNLTKSRPTYCSVHSLHVGSE